MKNVVIKAEVGTVEGKDGAEWKLECEEEEGEMGG